MKRILIYILALTAALMVPMQGTDVGKLEPVGLVQLYKEGECFVIVTDTGDSGVGKTAEEAFENLEETTAGIIFLDTADYLLISSDAFKSLEDLAGYLKPSVRICLAEGRIDSVEAAEYLNIHRPAVKLRECDGTRNLQRLIQENGRLQLK